VTNVDDPAQPEEVTGQFVPANEVKADLTRGYRAIASGWHKWRHEFEIAGEPVTSALMNVCCLQRGMRVLDVACGVGEPALKLAPRVSPGIVVAVDLVKEMLDEAVKAAVDAESANIRFAVADGEGLPFRDEVFDHVTCRGAIMYFPDAARALREAYRVLRPNGRAVFTSIGRADETQATVATLGVLQRYVPPPASSRQSPNPYRFAAPYTLAALFTSAGFRDVHEETRTVACPWPGNAEHFWSALPEHGLHLRELIESLEPSVRHRVVSDSIAALRQYERDGVLHLTTPVVIVSGVR